MVIFSRLYQMVGDIKDLTRVVICNVYETLICKLVYLFIVFGEHGRYIGNINHLW